MRCLRRWAVHRWTHRHFMIGVGDVQALLCDRRVRRTTRYYVRAGGLDWVELTRAQFLDYSLRSHMEGP